MVSVKVFFGTTGIAAVTCPECKTSRAVDLNKIGKTVNAFKANCKCGTSFQVVVDRRVYYRKQTSLIGRIRQNATATGYGVKITDISKTGVGFELTDALGNEDIVLALDQIYTVGFRLDDKHDSYVESSIIIRNIRGKHIGAIFRDTDINTQKVLGFYLMP